MTKTESDNFFFLHQNQNIFFSNIGNQNIFLEKKHNPPLKLNGRSFITTSFIIYSNHAEPNHIPVFDVSWSPFETYPVSRRKNNC